MIIEPTIVNIGWIIVPIKSRAFTVPSKISLLFLDICEMYGWYKVLSYALTVKSDPIDQETFVWTHNNNSLINPLESAAIEKTIVEGKSRSEGVSIWKSSIKIDAAGF